MSVCAGLVFEESVYSRVRGQGAKCVLRWPETREPGRGGTYSQVNALREDHDSGRVPLREGLLYICLRKGGHGAGAK